MKPPATKAHACGAPHEEKAIDKTVNGAHEWSTN
jgi:hypothetical protein